MVYLGGEVMPISSKWIKKAFPLSAGQILITKTDLLSCSGAVVIILDAYNNNKYTELLINLDRMNTKVIKIERSKYSMRQFYAYVLGILATLSPKYVNCDGVITLTKTDDENRTTQALQSQFVNNQNSYETGVNSLTGKARNVLPHGASIV